MRSHRETKKRAASEVLRARGRWGLLLKFLKLNEASTDSPSEFWPDESAARTPLQASTSTIQSRCIRCLFATTGACEKAQPRLSQGKQQAPPRRGKTARQGAIRPS